MRHRPSKNEAGFTLVELVIVIVVLGILGLYTVMNNGSPAAFTLYSQAQAMSSDMKHAQSLAMTWGKRLRISAVLGANGTYSVSCVTAGASPCNTSPVINPASGTAFTVALQRGVALDGPLTLEINSLGQPSAGATYTLSAGDASKTVSVAALTGHIAVGP